MGRLREHLDEAVFLMPQDRETDARAGGDESLRRMSEQYLDLTLAGRVEEAVGLVLTAADTGEDPADLLLEVLQPAQLELGRRWESGAISVAQEHLTTATTERLMALLHARLHPSYPRGAGRLAVAVAAGTGAHAIGLRMVTDLLEHAGWQVVYLGGGVPVPDVVAELVRQEADLLAVSASMPEQVRAVRELVEAVRDDPRCARVRTVVGGRLFRLAPGLAAGLGADALAGDAREAVEVCNRLVPAPAVR
jgi:methanogenic corrinoid protein MtbC1